MRVALCKLGYGAICSDDDWIRNARATVTGESWSFSTAFLTSCYSLTMHRHGGRVSNSNFKVVVLAVILYFRGKNYFSYNNYVLRDGFVQQFLTSCLSFREESVPDFIKTHDVFYWTKNRHLSATIFTTSLLLKHSCCWALPKETSPLCKENKVEHSHPSWCVLDGPQQTENFYVNHSPHNLHLISNSSISKQGQVVHTHNFQTSPLIMHAIWAHSGDIFILCPFSITCGKMGSFLVRLIMNSADFLLFACVVDRLLIFIAHYVTKGFVELFAPESWALGEICMHKNVLFWV